MSKYTAEVVLAYVKGYIDQSVKGHEHNLYHICESEETKDKERAIIRELKDIQETFNKMGCDWLAKKKEG